MVWRKRRAPLRLRLLEGRWTVLRKHPWRPAWRVLEPTHATYEQALEHVRALVDTGQPPVRFSGAEKTSQHHPQHRGEA